MDEKIKKFADEAVVLAQKWQDRANALLTGEERHIQEQMKQLLTRPGDKVLLTRLIDQSFRSHNPQRVAAQISYLLEESGIPDFFGSVEKLLVQMFMGIGRHFPSFAVPKMIEQMRAGSSRAIIPGEEKQLHAHLKKRKSQGIRMNINHLGEAVLGEKEAARRLATYKRDMQDPAIEYISIKISTIYSQISSLDIEHTIDVLKQRLSEIYREALANTFVRPDDTAVAKFVNLDMEEYRDLEPTFRAFIETLEQEEFLQLSAGIVLQAYLPDSFAMQQKLTKWAKNRIAQGGAPVKLRIVKGANMEMEKLESALNNWPLAPYDNKPEVDANYKRMVIYGMEPDNIRAVNLGIASHNLFELAFAAVLARKNAVSDFFYFEMLEGMADHVRRALQEISGDVLLYAPVAGKEEFINAIAYLIRRLDENTAPENFLRYAPSLETKSREWKFLQEGFLASCNKINSAQQQPNRVQNRNTENFPPEISSLHTNTFTNEPDTDWSLQANREWAEKIRSRWMKTDDSTPLEVPVVVGSQEHFADRKTRNRFDPNRLPEEITVARHALAGQRDILNAITVAKEDPDGWRSLTSRQRWEILAGVAMELRHARGDLIGAAAAETGKVFTETDVEVSEAIDFAEFYPWTASRFEAMENVQTRGKGVGLVISPWNFPVAIPCGGIVASLAAGNTVLFKPASDAVLTAWHLCQCFWRAGISKNVLQFIPCSGAQSGPLLTNSPDIDFIILTGGTDTGLGILQQNPGIYLAAETGGKNATIVTDMADRDQAIKNVIHSAFSNGGQKCSATSLLILEKSIYDDSHFKNQLLDAVQSMRVGPAWDFSSKIGPLIREPSGDLKNGMTNLERGEEWLLQPTMVDNNPKLWAPGIKYGVRPNSCTHMTEFFGPVLGVMEANDLLHAIDLVNQTGYGLTSGLESLDRREQELWKGKIFAGNLYINRGTTGAITLRQPFGGMGKSALGPGIKAGSPDYVSQFMEFSESGNPAGASIENDSYLLHLCREWHRLLRWNKLSEYRDDLRRTIHALQSYHHAMEETFAREQDFFHLRGQDNILRYLPVTPMVIRVHPDDSLFETLARTGASLVAGCETIVSLPPELDNNVTNFLGSRYGRQFLKNAELKREDDKTLRRSLFELGRIRYAAADRVPEDLFAAAAKSGFYISRTPVYMQGRIELLQYFQQQAICNSYHRYGNLEERSWDA